MAEIYRHWTASSIYCYKRGCRCSGCYIKEIMNEECRMKTAVLELVKRFGRPPEKPLIEGLTKSQNDVVMAILNGASTRAEIARALDITEANAQNRVGVMYHILELKGFEPLNVRNKLPEMVEWLRGNYLQC